MGEGRSSAKELGVRQQQVSQLLTGSLHYTEQIISRICNHYKIPVGEFKKLEYTDEVMTFVKQLCRDAGGLPFGDQSAKIRQLKIENNILTGENLILDAENHQLKWEIEKNSRAAQIVSAKIKTEIYVPV